MEHPKLQGERLSGSLSDHAFLSLHVLMHLPSPVAVLSGENFVITMANPALLEIWGKSEIEVIDQPYFEVFQKNKGQGIEALYELVLQTGETQTRYEVPFTFIRNGKTIEAFYNIELTPLRRQGMVDSILATGHDVTGEVKARKRLEASYAFSQSAFEAGPDAVLFTNMSGGIRAYNQNFIRLWKMPAAITDARDDEAALHHAMQQLTDPQAFLERVKWLYEHPQQTVRDELRFKDGRTIERFGYPVRNDDGAVEAWCWTFRDISDVKKQEETLLLSEDRYQNFIRQSTEGIWRFEVDAPIDITQSTEEQIECFFRDGWLAECNDAMAQMYGYEKAADLIGVRLSQFFPDDADARAYFRYFIESGYRVQEAESRELDRHGEARYFINNLVGIIEDKKLQRAWGTQRDITNQKLAEDRLHKAHHETEMQRRLYEAVTNSTPDLIYVFNLNYRFTYANKALLEMWGRNWEEAIGKGLRELGYEEWHAQLHEREIDEIAATKKTIRGTVSFPHATLGKRIYDYILSPVLNDQGEVEAVSGVTRDISDIKKVEEALLESEHRFRNLADSAPVMIWMTDETGHCFYLNKQWYDFTGQTIEEGHGMGWTNAVHPDERQKAGDIFMKASEACLPYRIEFRLRRHDGSYHWVIDSAEPRIDENGRFLGFIGSVVDIHYRKEAEEELRHLSYHLKLATESAGVGTWSFDTQTSRLEWSDLHKEMWGYGKDSSDLTYQDWYKVIVPEDFEESLERVEYARIHRLNYENEYRIRRAGDGVIRWMRSFGQFLYNEAGEAYKLTGITVDITLQKEAEEALMESEERFRNLADNAPMWVWLSDENANVTYVNKEELAFFGLTKVEDFTAKAWEQSIHPDDLPLLYEVYSHAVQHRQPYTLEARLRNVATGQYEWFHFRGVPRTEHGEFKGIIGTANNIQQQRMLTEHLEALVAERTQELKRSNEDLQQFAHVASHDLKEPVRKIRTFLSRLEMEFGEQLPQRGRTYMEKIAHSARRMTDMIDGVLQFSSVGVHEQKPDLIDLNEVMQDIEGDLEILIHQKKALLSYEGLPVIMGSPVLIHQLFYNLVNNSLKFSKDDVPVSVHVYCRSGNDASIRPGYTEVVIEDNGIGFSQKHAQRIFQTFTRLNSKDEYEGTGLGLALCQKIVERHGGTIRAEGEEGKGARFVITLPTNT